ncbi:MAG: integrase family protein [Aestuariivirga sp.]
MIVKNLRLCNLNDIEGWFMPEIHLTKRSVERLPYPTVGQVFYRDNELRGFGLRVGRRSKVFVVEARVARRSVRVTIGRADVFFPEVARKHAQRLLGEMAGGKNPNQAKKFASRGVLTLELAFTKFFEAKPQLSNCTKDGYSRTRNLYLKDWGSKELATLTAEMVMVKHRLISRTNGNTTANSVMRHLRSVYNFASGAIAELPPNPVVVLTKTRTWHRETRRRRIVVSSDLPRWWRAVMHENEDARDIHLIALFTGMRRSEITGLKWEYLDLVERVLTIPRTKNGEPLQLPLADHLVQLFRQRQTFVGQSEYVFPSRSKSRHVTEVKSMVDRVRTASGVEFTLHDLRRTFISIAESLDIPYYALKRLLNHRMNGDVTQGYIVIGPERLREPVEKVATHILALVSGQGANPLQRLAMAGVEPIVPSPPTTLQSDF